MRREGAHAANRAAGTAHFACRCMSWHNKIDWRAASRTAVAVLKTPSTFVFSTASKFSWLMISGRCSRAEAQAAWGMCAKEAACSAKKAHKAVAPVRGPPDPSSL